MLRIFYLVIRMIVFPITERQVENGNNLATWYLQY